MTKKKFKLGAALNSLRTTDRSALDELLLDSAADGNFPAVEALLNAGANIDVKDFEGWTPLNFAVINGHTATGKLLREAELLREGGNARREREPGKPGPRIDDIRAALKALQQG
jgi:hypothetical protein